MKSFYESDFPASKCSWFEMLCARFFGKKIVTTDHGWRTVVYDWRGHTYLHSMDPL
jgi:hypothetical protein